MKHTLLLTLMIIASATLSFAQADNSKAIQEIDKLTETFRAAYFRRDTEVLNPLLAEDFLIVSNPATPGVNKTLFLAGLKRPLVSPQRWDSYEFSEVVKHAYGDAVIVFSVVTQKGMNPNNEPYTSRWRATTTAVKRQDSWQIAAIHLSSIPRERVAAKVDPKVFDAYVGQYQFPSAVITVAREGDKLFWQASTSTSKLELIPANDTTFYLPNSQTQNLFVKDESGKVTHVKQILSDGNDASFKKIK